MDIYPFKICGSGYDIISEKSGYDPFLDFLVTDIHNSHSEPDMFSNELYVIC